MRADRVSRSARGDAIRDFSSPTRAAARSREGGSTRLSRPVRLPLGAPSVCSGLAAPSLPPALWPVWEHRKDARSERGLISTTGRSSPPRDAHPSGSAPGTSGRGAGKQRGRGEGRKREEREGDGREAERYVCQVVSGARRRRGGAEAERFAARMRRAGVERGRRVVVFFFNQQFRLVSDGPLSTFSLCNVSSRPRFAPSLFPPSLPPPRIPLSVTALFTAPPPPFTAGAGRRVCGRDRASFARVFGSRPFRAASAVRWGWGGSWARGLSGSRGPSGSRASRGGGRDVRPSSSVDAARVRSERGEQGVGALGGAERSAGGSHAAHGRHLARRGSCGS